MVGRRHTKASGRCAGRWRDFSGDAAGAGIAEAPAPVINVAAVTYVRLTAAPQWAYPAPQRDG